MTSDTATTRADCLEEVATVMMSAARRLDSDDAVGHYLRRQAVELHRAAEAWSPLERRPLRLVRQQQ